MSEYAGDESTPIPFVKIYGDLDFAPQPTVHTGDDVFLYVELINMGTAPSRNGDTLTGFLSFEYTGIHQESIDFPPIEPNGGTWRHIFKFEGWRVAFPGDWGLSAMVTNAGTIGEVQDSQRVDFVVSPRG